MKVSLRPPRARPRSMISCSPRVIRATVRFLQTGSIINSVNFPAVNLEPAGGFRLAVTNRNVPGLLGQLVRRNR